MPACTYTQNKCIKKTKHKIVKFLFKQVFPFIIRKKAEILSHIWTVHIIYFIC